jgi:hypothetical protein
MDTKVVILLNRDQEVVKVASSNGDTVSAEVVYTNEAFVNLTKQFDRCSANGILSRDGTEVGRMTGGNPRACPLEGCRGERKGVRWSDGKLSYVCTRSIIWNSDKNMWQLV